MPKRLAIGWLTGKAATNPATDARRPGEPADCVACQWNGPTVSLAKKWGGRWDL